MWGSPTVGDELTVRARWCGSWAAAWASKVGSWTTMPLAPFDLGQCRRHDVGFGLLHFLHVVGGHPGVGEGLPVVEVEERFRMLGLARAG